MNTIINIQNAPTTGNRNPANRDTAVNRARTALRSSALLAALLLSACSDDASGDHDADVHEPDATADVTADTDDQPGDCDPLEAALEALGDNDTAPGAAVDPTCQDGVVSFTLDASVGGIANAPAAAWVYLDVDAFTIVDLTDRDAATSDQWDIAFKRAEIRINSGDSGPGNWMMIAVADTSFDDVAAPDPAAGWRTDSFVDPDDCSIATYGMGEPETAFAQWYTYDFETHGVSAPEGTIFVLYDLATHRAFRLAIDGWAGGVFTARWAQLADEPVCSALPASSTTLR